MTQDDPRVTQDDPRVTQDDSRMTQDDLQVHSIKSVGRLICLYRAFKGFKDTLSWPEKLSLAL